MPAAVRTESTYSERNLYLLKPPDTRALLAPRGVWVSYYVTARDIVATRYGIDGPGIEAWWGGEIFRTCPDRPRGPPSLLYNGYRVFIGGKAAGAWR